MMVSKFRPIVLGYIHVDFILLDPAVPEIFHFKHDVGSFLILIFVGNPDVDNCHE